MKGIFQRPFIWYFLPLALMGFGMQRAIAQSDVTGYWDVRSPNPSGDGIFRDTYIHIEQNGEALSAVRPDLSRVDSSIPGE